jgi:hypothetical protein
MEEIIIIFHVFFLGMDLAGFAASPLFLVGILPSLVLTGSASPHEALDWRVEAGAHPFVLTAHSAGAKFICQQMTHLTARNGLK